MELLTGMSNTQIERHELKEEMNKDTDDVLIEILKEFLKENLKDVDQDQGYWIEHKVLRRK